MWETNSREDRKHTLRMSKHLKRWIGEFKKILGLEHENGQNN
jgi:hypothetical protein